VSSNEQAWQREALRLYQRYEIEIVEACGLCPWAERARLEGRVLPRVVLAQGEEAVTASVSVMEEIERDRQIEVALLVYPRCTLDRVEFQAFMARVREADAARHELGTIPFVMAAFHPDAPPDLSHPERLIPFLRRTPDPTIQLLRTNVLDRVRGPSSQGTQFIDVEQLDFSAKPEGEVVAPLRERIARANLTTVQRLGVPEMDRRLRDIQRDREATYRALHARD
jgi:hypothetical protein